MKNCFKKFLRASVPSTPSEFNETSVNHHSNHNQYSFLKQIHDSKWFDSVSVNIRDVKKSYFIYYFVFRFNK